MPAHVPALFKKERTHMAPLLRIAVEDNLSKIARMLIHHDADPNSRSYSVAEQNRRRVPILLLHPAVKNKNDAVIKSLLPACADPKFLCRKAEEWLAHSRHRSNFPAYALR